MAYAPKSWLVQGKHSWDSTIRREPDRWADYTGSRYNIIYTGDDDAYRDTARAMLWVATSPVKIVTTPFTYTLSKPAWDIMIRRTGTMFDKPGDFNDRPVREVPEQPRTGALALFLDRLMHFQSESGIQLDITLIGHRTGSAGGTLEQYASGPAPHTGSRSGSHALQNFRAGKRPAGARRVR